MPDEMNETWLSALLFARRRHDISQYHFAQLPFNGCHRIFALVINHIACNRLKRHCSFVSLSVLAILIQTFFQFVFWLCATNLDHSEQHIGLIQTTENPLTKSRRATNVTSWSHESHSNANIIYDICHLIIVIAERIKSPRPKAQTTVWIKWRDRQP